MRPSPLVCVQYKKLFDILAGRRRRKAIVGSGSYTFFHQKKVRAPVLTIGVNILASAQATRALPMHARCQGEMPRLVITIMIIVVIIMIVVGYYCNYYDS